MIGIVRDTWRAVLVIVVAVVLDGVLDDRRPPPVTPPAVATQAPPPWQPAPVLVPAQQPQHIVIHQQPERPLRRVVDAVVGLGDSVIGVVR